MKILHINSYYSGSKFYKNLYESQNNMGFDIDVFVPVASNAKFADFNYGKYTIISRNHNKYDRLFFHIKHNKIFRDIQAKYNISDYSIIHAHSLFSNGYIALKLKRKYAIPYIVAVRNTDVNVFFEKMIQLRSLGVEILKEAAHVIFLSKSYEEQVISKYVPQNLKNYIKSKVSIIPNGIDDFWHYNINIHNRELNLPYLQLLQVGDINKNKNIITTVKAIDILTKEGYKVKLNVVGRIKDNSIFEKIKDLEYVNYMGFFDKEELIKLYKENDIFILPSIKETFGLVYAEAMSQGLPVIYTKGQGFDGQFKDGEIGFAVQHNSPEEIAERIHRIIDRYNEISKNCLKNIDKFRWDNIVKEYAILYERNKK